MQSNSFIKRIYPVILLTIVVGLSTALLSFTDGLTRPIIKAQEEAALLAPLKDIFPDMTDYESAPNGVFVLKAGSNTVGYAFAANGTGYGGAISILVALQDKATVKGIRIISQNETPGLGTRIQLPSFTDRFANVPIADVKLSAEGGKIDGISGSTISSRAVVDAVRNTALEKVQALP